MLLSPRLFNEFDVNILPSDYSIFGLTQINRQIPEMDFQNLILTAVAYFSWPNLMANSVEITKKQNHYYHNYRLPNDVIPMKYTLKITTNMVENDFTFKGEVRIKIRCKQAVDRIILHSRNLYIEQNEVKLTLTNDNNETVDDEQSIPIVDRRFIMEHDFYEITLADKLNPANVYLYYIPFEGKLQENLSGYYRTRYIDETSSDKVRWLAITQFEPTDARKAFPCFDEPAMKAIFSISLGHSDKFKAISNMPLKESEPIFGKKNWVLDTFEDTPPVSTYLIAYMISDLECRQFQLSYPKNMTYRIWARKAVIEQTKLAADIGPKLLAFFQKHFNLDFPLPKQDMVALPDFCSAAMENWGLITFRENALLYDPNESSLYNKHMTASVISHELSHQWFGNLVTMNWWTDLWLNEGFATYVGSLGVKHVFPEWKSFETEILTALLTVFSLDALKSSHPVSVPIEQPNEIDQIFDIISYQKGYYLLHMIKYFLTETVFWKGVNKYLLRHSYANAIQDDLWQSLTEAAHEMRVLDTEVTVKTIMDTWTLTAGYPLVTVRRDYKNRTIAITQERYFSRPVQSFDIKSDDIVKMDNDRDECRYHWQIPLSYTTSLEMDFQIKPPKLWLTDNDQSITVNSLRKLDWIIFNIQTTGLYRVNYDSDNWILLGRTLLNPHEYKYIDKMNRVQLIIDMLSLAWVNKLEYRIVFDTLQYLRHEADHLVWRAALTALEEFKAILLHSGAYEQFKKFVRYLIEPTYERFGKSITMMPTSDFEVIKHHCMMVNAACHYDVPDCKRQTRSLFENWYHLVVRQGKNRSGSKRSNPIPTSLRRTIYCNALKESDESRWIFLWNRYTSSSVPSEKMVILETLGCTKNLDILERYLQWSLDPAKIKRQDSALVFINVAYSENGYYAATEFLLKNFTDIYVYHESRPSVLGRYVEAIANQITTKEVLNLFEKFVKLMSEQLRGAVLSIDQGIETAKNNIVWRENNFQTVSEYLMNMKI